MTGGSQIKISLTLNGLMQNMEGRPDARLIDLLRDERQLTASKSACGIGRCGACTVLLDGLPANACLLMLWQLDGRDILTPEGLDAMPEAGIILAALAEENAFQCGYCAPGFSMVLVALLREKPDAGEPEIRAALEGNICRCTGYHSIIRGALAAADLLRAQRRSAGVAI
jgi:carbon-monoxide dehydrogenase small subunit